MDCIYKDVCLNECSESCVRYLEMSYLLDNSNIPKHMQKIIRLIPDDCDYETFVELADIKDNIKEFVDKGCNLYLLSKNTGNGKTTWAIKMMLKYFDEIWAGNGLNTRAVFIHVPTFLLKCKDFNNKDTDFEELKSKLLTVDLVVWDDIGSNGLSNYDLSQLLMHIDQRMLSGKSNIFTGNLGQRELENLLGSRLASRIYNASTVLELFGKDKRNYGYGSVTSVVENN